MDAWVDRIPALSSQPLLQFLALLVPALIALAALTGWARRVPGAGVLALGGAALALWLVVPLRPAQAELATLLRYATILGWVWLVWAWAKHVLTEWPAPIWGHWLAGTALLALCLSTAAALLQLA